MFFISMHQTHMELYTTGFSGENIRFDLKENNHKHNISIGNNGLESLT